MTLSNEDLKAISDLIQPIKNDIQEVKNDMQGVKNDIQEVKNDIQGVKNDIQGVKNDIQGVKQRVSNIENKVTNIELTLENEISVNIKHVAEGHLDLSRNLHDALKIDNEKEMIAIRVNILESELRRIKEKLNNIA